MSDRFGYSPWTDAASYGEGLGRTLSEAMLQMPQQRAMLQQQAMQMRQQQQMEMLKYALQQKQQQAEQSLGQSELTLKQQELAQNTDYHKAEMQQRMAEAQAAQLRAQNEAKGTFKFGETKDGEPYVVNTLTGEHKWIPKQDEGGLGGTPRPVIPQTQNQQYQNLDKLGALAAHYKMSGMDTNLPGIFQAITNSIPKLGMQPQQPVPQGLGAIAPQSNNPVVPTATARTPYKIVDMGTNNMGGM